MDESEVGQILTLDELRALRDRMGAEVAAARQARNAAQEGEVPTPPAVIPLEARTEAWESLRHRARHRQSWPRRSWFRRLAAVGCLALAGGTVTVLVITAHPRSDPRSAGEISVPALPTPVVSPPVVSLPPVTTSSAPEPASSTAPVPVIPPVPGAAAPGGSAENTTKLPAATVHAPRATHRPAPSRTSAPPTDGRPPPTVVNLDQPRPGAAANRAGATSAAAQPPCAGGCPHDTVVEAPNSWSPAAPQ
ncbi:MAG: hypothetical protein ACRDQU_08850 [Pseudonocardiaceae bacterium]